MVSFCNITIFSGYTTRHFCHHPEQLRQCPQGKPTEQKNAARWEDQETEKVRTPFSKYVYN